MVENRFPYLLQHAFDESVNVFASDERHFEINLSEFGLAIGTLIFVAEASSQLKVFVAPSHHEKLFELLRRLGESKEEAGLGSRGDDIFSGSFGCAFKEDGSFDFEETFLIEVVSNHVGDAVSNPKVCRHSRPAKIEVTVLESEVFVNVFLIQGIRRCFGSIEEGESGGLDFDLPCFELGVYGAFRAGDDFTFDRNHKFRSKRRSFGDDLWINDDLREAFAIPEIHEDEAAVVASGVYPPRQKNGLADMVFSKFRAMIGAIGVHG